VYGAVDPKAGAVGSLYDVPADIRLNHRPPVTAGIRATECGDLLRSFFAERRLSSPRRGDNVPPRKDARVDEWDGLESR
jgi:tRNA(adenine34) deaminase